METIGFLGGDARMAYLARLLAADGYAVRSWALADAPNEGTPSEAAAAERVILPVPLAKEGKLRRDISAGDLREVLGQELLLPDTEDNESKWKSFFGRLRK